MPTLLIRTLALFYEKHRKMFVMGDVKHLQGSEAIEKMKKIAETVDFCMFCTETDSIPFSARPMSTQEVDGQGNFWFMSRKTSNKNQEIATDSKVQLLYANPSKSEFLSVSGTATAFYDYEKVEELWSPFVKTWFEEGKDDPELTLIKVTPEEGHYWDTKDGKAITMLKIVVGSVIGKDLDAGIEGDVKPR